MAMVARPVSSLHNALTCLDGQSASKKSLRCKNELPMVSDLITCPVVFVFKVMT